MSLRAGAVAALLAALAAAGPAAASPSVARCALGSSAADLRGFYGEALERAEDRYAARTGAGRRLRRAFAAAAVARVHGLAPVSVRGTIDVYPANTLIGVAALTEPGTRTVVSPNQDTAYTIARLDLSAGPLVIDVPDTDGRYYVLHLMDAWSDTFGYVGRRTTGTRAGSHVIVPPGWSGSLPAGMRAIRSPTNRVWLLGRTVVNGAADLPAVAAVLRRYTATPMADWLAGRRVQPIVLSAFPGALPPLVVPRGLAFLDALGRVLADDPPPAARDACVLRALRRAGVDAGRRPAVEQRDPSVRAALEAGVRAGARIVTRAVAVSNARSRRGYNGWMRPQPYAGVRAARASGSPAGPCPGGACGP
jgi:hypothetical protein